MKRPCGIEEGGNAPEWRLRNSLIFRGIPNLTVGGETIRNVIFEFLSGLHIPNIPDMGSDVLTRHMGTTEKFRWFGRSLNAYTYSTGHLPLHQTNIENKTADLPSPGRSRYWQI